MSLLPANESPRLLIVDDNPSIHGDFRKILGGEAAEMARLNHLENTLFDSPSSTEKRITYRLDSANQGQEALAMVQLAMERKDPYMVAFVDVRMPPGWDGIETLERVWQSCPDLQAVLCTAYSDYSWDQITRRLVRTDKLLILKKPFDTIEVLQLAHALTQKWTLARQAKLRMEDLDRLVRERTQQLREEMEERARIQESFRQAQKMEAVGCLAAGVAHEFNNLLTVIQGHAGLLRDRNVDPRFTAESVARIQQASERAASLTRRLLAFSRKQPLELKLVNLSGVVEGLRDMLTQLIGENYALEIECAANLPVAFVDESNLEQVLLNLVLNARDAMSKGGTIRIGTSLITLDEVTAREHFEARPGRFICLAVSDTGCGIAPEVLGRIFDPFFTTKEIGKGTGLGLSTVQSTIHQHKGWVQVSSELGHGSTFKTFLPVWDGTTGLRPAGCGSEAKPAEMAIPVS